MRGARARACSRAPCVHQRAHCALVLHDTADRRPRVQQLFSARAWRVDGGSRGAGARGPHAHRVATTRRTTTNNANKRRRDGRYSPDHRRSKRSCQTVEQREQKKKRKRRRIDFAKLLCETSLFLKTPVSNAKLLCENSYFAKTHISNDDAAVALGIPTCRHTAPAR